MSRPSTPQAPDRFTLPRDIPDAGYWDASTRSAARNLPPSAPGL